MTDTKTLRIEGRAVRQTPPLTAFPRYAAPVHNGRMQPCSDAHSVARSA